MSASTPTRGARHGRNSNIGGRRGQAGGDFEEFAVGDGGDAGEFFDEFFVFGGDGARLTIEIVEATGVDAAVFFGELSVPINLVGEAVPGEAEDGDAVAAHA